MSAAHSRSAEPRLGLLRAPPVPTVRRRPAPELSDPLSSCCRTNIRHPVEETREYAHRHAISGPSCRTSPPASWRYRTAHPRRTRGCRPVPIPPAAGRDDRRGGCAGPELRSYAHWLSWRIGMSLQTAGEHVRVAHALAKLPAVTAAFAAGKISTREVRAITRLIDTRKSEQAVSEAARPLRRRSARSRRPRQPPAARRLRAVGAVSMGVPDTGAMTRELAADSAGPPRHRHGVHRRPPRKGRAGHSPPTGGSAAAGRAARGQLALGGRRISHSRGRSRALPTASP